MAHNKEEKVNILNDATYHINEVWADEVADNLNIKIVGFFDFYKGNVTKVAVVFANILVVNTEKENQP